MEFIPDLRLTAKEFPGHCIDVYLNGELIDRCFEARVKYESFETPTFGEIIVGSGPTAWDGPKRVGKWIVVAADACIVRMPKLGEFELDGVWVRFKCGKVKIEIAPDHLEEVNKWLAVARSQSQSPAR